VRSLRKRLTALERMETRPLTAEECLEHTSRPWLSERESDRLMSRLSDAELQRAIDILRERILQGDAEA